MSDKLRVAETYPIENFWQTQIVCKGGGEVFATSAGHTKEQSRERAERIVAAEAALSEAREERDQARAGLERDRIKLADALKAIREATASRFWLTEGRGFYEWDDDRYREEFGYAIAEINDAIRGLESVASDWRDCPQTSAGVAKARIDLQRQVTQQAATISALADALKKIRGMSTGNTVAVLRFGYIAEACYAALASIPKEDPTSKT